MIAQTRVSVTSYKQYVTSFVINKFKEIRFIISRIFCSLIVDQITKILWLHVYSNRQLQSRIIALFSYIVYLAIQLPPDGWREWL